MKSSLLILLPVLALLIPVSGCSLQESLLPRPTEHRLAHEAEFENKRARGAWVREMHRAAPGVDWRAIEKENGLREQRRRSGLTARKMKPAKFGGWREVGSSNQAGRMHCTRISPDGYSLYAGSSLGGIWRGSLDGTNWEPLGDNLFGGVHDLVVIAGEQAGDPPIMMVGRDSGAVHVSRDDGRTWEEPNGLPVMVNLRGMGVLDDGIPTLLVYGRRSNLTPAIYASTDFGRTFHSRWAAVYNHTGWMWVPRTGPGAANTVYILHRGRLRVSTDGGVTCPVVAQIDTAAEQGVLTGCEAGAPTLYAALRVSGQWQLHRSDDGGSSWTFTHNIGDFWESLCASTLYSNRVVYGGVETYRSTNSGVTFKRINQWGDYYGDPENKLHADIPGIFCWPDPLDPWKEIWHICTDGGVYESRDACTTVRNLSLEGLGVSQYYSTLTSSNRPDLILAGAQDQGYQRGSYNPGVGAGPHTAFAQLISGDYGHLTSSDGSHDLVYSVYPGFVLVQEGEDNPSLLSPFVDFPSGANHAWLPPIKADPLDPETFFFCGEKLYRYDRSSGPYWNYTQHSSQDFTVGGGSYLSGLAFAPTDANRVYAVTNGGRLFYSTDHGVNWTQGSGSVPDQHYFYGNAITVHPDNPLEAAVGGSGYSTAGVIRTQDGGQTWFAEDTGLPQTLVYCLTYQEGTGDLYAGTETGAFRWNRKTGQWENILAGNVPITIYWSVETIRHGKTIRFGTYGRGIWDYTPSPKALPRIR